MLGCRVNFRDDGMSVECFERGNLLYFLMISHSGVAIRENRKGSGENKVYYTHSLYRQETRHTDAGSDGIDTGADKKRKAGARGELRPQPVLGLLWERQGRAG